MRPPSLYRLLGINLALESDRNALYLVLEIFFAAVLGAAGTFNSAYALRLGASNADIGLLTSLPALIAVVISIPAGRFLQTRARRKPWFVTSLLIHRMGFALVALAPLVKIAGLNQGTLAVIILVIFSAGAHFFNVGWIPMLAEVVQPERRAAIFTARNVVYNATVSLVVLLFGWWLEKMSFPVNYQGMYLFGFAASLLSQYFIIKIAYHESPPQPVEQKKFSLKEQWLAMKEALRAEPMFQRLTTNTVMHGIGLWLVSPLYILYYVRDLDASDAWIGLNNTVLTAATILGWLIWQRVIQRTGETAILRIMIMTLGVVPVLVGLIPNLNLILLAVALNGLITPAVNLSHFNTLLKVTPAADRPLYTGLYTSIVNIGAFICPLIGVAVADITGFVPALIIFGVMSIVGSSSFLWRPVKVQSDE